MNMKKLIAAGLALTMLTGVTVSATAAVKYKYVKNGAHLRSGAGMNYKSIRVIGEGGKVKLLGTEKKVKGTTWVKVKYGNKTGWISKKCLQTAKPAASAEPEPVPSPGY